MMSEKNSSGRYGGFLPAVGWKAYFMKSAATGTDGPGGLPDLITMPVVAWCRVNNREVTLAPVVCDSFSCCVVVESILQFGASSILVGLTGPGEADLTYKQALRRYSNLRNEYVSPVTSVAPVVSDDSIEERER